MDRPLVREQIQAAIDLAYSLATVAINIVRPTTEDPPTYLDSSVIDEKRRRIRLAYRLKRTLDRV